MDTLGESDARCGERVDALAECARLRSESAIRLGAYARAVAACSDGTRAYAPSLRERVRTLDECANVLDEHANVLVERAGL